MIKFYYGTMGAGKTTELIKTYDIYKRKGLEPVILRPAIDTREGKQEGWGITTSRITKESVPCYYYNDILDIYKLKNKSILVDECQFMKPSDVEYLVCYADECNIPLLGYGLKTDINGNLFEGAKKWLALSDISIELENLCQVEGCTNKAILHKRFINGKPDKSTQSIVIDGVDNVTYLSVCRKHWRE